MSSLFQKKGLQPWLFSSPKRCARPFGHFTVKQKCLIHSADVLALETVKLRPLIAHDKHPARLGLKRIARALALLVETVIPFVKEKRPQHTPMWRLHAGTLSLLLALQRSISSGVRIESLVELDVADCFLNTLRSSAIPALVFWLGHISKRSRSVYFSISKDSKNADYIGQSASHHFWCFSGAELLAFVEWELSQNDTFEILHPSSNETIVLRQVRGLPMGGHLSASLVELVALFREYTQLWPQFLDNVPTARYRDNFFLGMEMPFKVPLEAVAQGLTVLLDMPVKLEGFGTTRRFLEVKLELRNTPKIHAELAFRDDADRQGESNDVSSWPPRHDPRIRQLLPALLAGLASKIRQYHAKETGGLTASWRRAVQFLKRRAYPEKWWRRPLALSALRQGIARRLLPRCLRAAL